MLVLSKLNRYILGYEKFEPDNYSLYRCINTEYIGYCPNKLVYGYWSYYIHNNAIYRFHENRVCIYHRFNDYHIEQVFIINEPNYYDKNITCPDRIIEYEFECNYGKITTTFKDKTYSIMRHYKLINKKYKLLSICIYFGCGSKNSYPTAIVYQNHTFDLKIYEIKLYGDRMKIKSFLGQPVIFQKV